MNKKEYKWAIILHLVLQPKILGLKGVNTYAEHFSLVVILYIIIHCRVICAIKFCVMHANEKVLL